MVASALLAVAACGSRPSQVQVVRMAYQHEMVSLDPHAHDDSVTGSVLSGLYQGLVALSPGRTIDPCLAERWTTPDDRTWRFWLRRDVRFHDGRAMTVEDVVASLQRARLSADSALATYLEVLSDVRAVAGDEPVVEIVTRDPFPLLLTRLVMVAVVPRDFDPRVPTGTGPYMWVAGSVKGPVLLRRWGSYWGPKPTADEVSIRFVDQEDLLERLIRAQQLDVVSISSQDFIHTHAMAHPWRLIGIPSAATTILGLNIAKAPLQDPRVREAIDRAVDRRELVARVFPGGGAEPASCLAPATVFGYTPGPGPAPADHALGRRLLAEAGVAPGTRLRVDYSGVYRPAVDFLVSSLAQIGLEAEVHERTFDALYRGIEQGTNELYLFGWNFGFADASDFLDAVAHSRDVKRRLGLLNGTRYSNPEVDSWIEEAAREPREGPRLELLRSALNQIAGERTYVPLFYHARFALVRSPFSLEATGRAWVVPQAVTVAPTG
jgi:peptide/nickel transport system substrate-binding protein